MRRPFAADSELDVTLGPLARMTTASLAWMTLLTLQGGGPAYRPVEAPGPVAITPQAAYEVAPDLPAPIAQAPVTVAPARP